MIRYWLLLLPVAAFSYIVGSFSTLVLASNFIFRSNLKKLGTGNSFLSNFRRVYGMNGALKLLALELVKDIVPIVLGGILLGTKGHADVGRAFAGFCLVLGRLFPLFYEFRGSHAVIPLLVSAIFADISLGIVGLIFVVAVLLVTKYVSVAAVAGALIVAAASVLIVGNNLVITLLALTGGLIVIKHIPSMRRFFRGEEEKFSFREDLSYKFDEKF